MNRNEIAELIGLVRGDAIAYNEVNKARFHVLGKKILRVVAKELGLQKGTYDIRSNMAGIAVSGEITLHSEHLYIDLSQGGVEGMFMYRSCRGRKDYVGGHNQWMGWINLSDLYGYAIPAFKGVIERASSVAVG